jgi:hypothetical protein
MKSSCSAATTVRSSDFPFDYRRGLTSTALVYALAWLAAQCGAAFAHPTTEIRFDIRTDALVDALDRFSEQAGLQIVYDPAWVANRKVTAVSGTMTAAAALDQLLRGSDLVWHSLNDLTVVLNRRSTEKTLPAGEPESRDDTTYSSSVVVLEKYVKLTKSPIDPDC